MPTLDDNGVIIWDSHAICTYLIGKYASDDSLYPKDLVKRAHIDQRLHFDSGVLFSSLRAANMLVYLGGSMVPDDKIAALHEALGMLEIFLKDADYLVGNNFTLADICCLTNATFFEIHFPIEKSKYPNICRWIENLSTVLPNFDELVTKPTADFKILFENLKQTNAAAAAAN